MDFNSRLRKSPLLGLATLGCLMLGFGLARCATYDPAPEPPPMESSCECSEPEGDQSLATP